MHFKIIYSDVTDSCTFNKLLSFFSPHRIRHTTVGSEKRTMREGKRPKRATNKVGTVENEMREIRKRGIAEVIERPIRER